MSPRHESALADLLSYMLFQVAVTCLSQTEGWGVDTEMNLSTMSGYLSTNLSGVGGGDGMKHVKIICPRDVSLDLLYLIKMKRLISK